MINETAAFLSFTFRNKYNVYVTQKCHKTGK